MDCGRKFVTLQIEIRMVIFGTFWSWVDVVRIWADVV